jgi:hypothetical protein
LDDVQYTKRDWRNRNKIKTKDHCAWLTVPVHQKTISQLICETHIDYSQTWWSSHINLLDQWYKNSPHYLSYRDVLADHLKIKYPNISALNIQLIKWCMNILQIKTPCILSSELNVEGSKTERLINILKKLNATEYLSGPSAKNYLEEKYFYENHIKLSYKNYLYKDYPQLWGDFRGDFSILDLIFNMGNDSRSYIKTLGLN